MLLTIDIGNTCMKLGLYDDTEQVAFIYTDTVSNDYRSMILSFLFKNNIREDSISKVIIANVVPSIHSAVMDALTSIFTVPIIDIDPLKNYGVVNSVPNPEEVGDDIVVMCSYAYHLFQRELLVVSMGTCTVINHVTADGQFKHCIIAPGLLKMAETLWKNAALLPEVNLEKRSSFLADETNDCIQVGVVDGYIGMLKYLINGISEELGSKPFVVACGGEGKKIYSHVDEIDYFDADLVSAGLHYICTEYENE